MDVDYQSLIATLCPNASPLCKSCFADAGTVLPRYGVDTPLRLAHLLAQVLNETGGLSSQTLTENLNYSAQELHACWPSRFPTLAVAGEYGVSPQDTPAEREAKCQRIAETVYGHRQDLGNLYPGDGAAFIGRDLIQITGRAMYANIGSYLSLDLTNHPELACDPAHALEITCVFWDLIKKLNPWADKDDLVEITLLVNGGEIGLATRQMWLTKAKAALGVA